MDRWLRASLPVGCALWAAAALWPVAAEPWPEFRGPTKQGISAETGLPLRWSDSENVAWKAAIPGRGWSTPVIGNGRVWLTTAADQGRSLRALALDASSGRIVVNVEVFRHHAPPSIHNKNSYASPTPILDGGRVYVHFGALGTAALNTGGEILWKQQGLRYAHGHGPGGSPELVGGRLIVNCDGTDRQFVAALDKNTGEVRWQTNRQGGRMAYSTPLAIEAGGRTLVVSVGGDVAGAFDPATGEQLWRVRFDGFSNVPRPVSAHGMVYIATGFYRPGLLAVRLGGSGDVTRSHVVWRTSRGVPLTSSPIVVGDELYMVSDNGIASCLDARTGERRWQQRLGGNFSASPVAAGGRIYFLNESGETTVLAAGKQFQELAKNQVNGETLASLAPSGGAIYLRTHSHVYRINQEP